jgi:multicomponent Na+:H+ antiporter subunit E
MRPRIAMPHNPALPQPAPRIPMLLLLPLCALWWILAGDDPASWWVGAPVVFATAWLLRPRGRAGVRVRPTGVAAFLVYFVRGSFAGGVDVALRVARPSLPIDPAFVTHRLRHPEGHPARLLAIAALSLLPGTLAAGVDEDLLIVHALDPRFASPTALAELEDRAGAVFAPAGGGR